MEVMPDEAERRSDEAEVEALRVLHALDGGDPEVTHSEADDALVAYLRAIGHGVVADAYETARDRVGFWYA